MKLPNTKNESHVKKAVKKILDEHHWFWWMTPANGYGRSGISDFCAVKQGMFMVIETKANGNDPTPMQLGYLNSIRAADHLAFIIREDSVDALKTFLQYLDQAIVYKSNGQTPPVEIGGPMTEAVRVIEEHSIHKGRTHAKNPPDPAAP